MTKLNDLQERLKNFEEQQKKLAEENAIKEKEAQLAKIEAEQKAKDEQILQLQNELKDKQIESLKAEIESLKPQEQPIPQGNPQQRVIGLPVLTLLIVFIGAMYYLMSSSDIPKTPDFVNDASSNLGTGITVQYGTKVTCPSKQINGRWFLGCRVNGGSNIALFEVLNRKPRTHIKFRAYAINGNALSLMNKERMQVYQIARNQDTSIDIQKIISQF